VRTHATRQFSTGTPDLTLASNQSASVSVNTAIGYRQYSSSGRSLPLTQFTICASSRVGPSGNHPGLRRGFARRQAGKPVH
jgi:hypothetical protein